MKVPWQDLEQRTGCRVELEDLKFRAQRSWACVGLFQWCGCCWTFQLDSLNLPRLPTLSYAPGKLGPGTAHSRPRQDVNKALSPYMGQVPTHSPRVLSDLPRGAEGSHFVLPPSATSLAGKLPEQLISLEPPASLVSQPRGSSKSLGTALGAIPPFRTRPGLFPKFRPRCIFGESALFRSHVLPRGL